MSQKYYPRWQEKRIKTALETRRILLLVGPRQCGKTTLAKKISVPNTIYRTLDDQTLLESALSDPHGFVRHGDHLMIIDEIQRAPTLLGAIKKDVDENQNYGRFLLTGSSNLQFVPGVKESLAGRLRKIRLRPLAVGEIRQSRANFIKNIFAGRLRDLVNNEKMENLELDKEHYLSQAFEGGYPEALRMNNRRNRRLWYQDYLHALIEHDLKDIAQIRRKDSLLKLVEVLASWSAKFIDISAIGSALSLARPTLENYINALEALYLVERVRPWHKTDYERVGKQDKLFMTDTGLMTAILRWRVDQVHLNGELNGKLMETFVFTQLAAHLEVQDEDYGLFHYRDREKREIDFIIENEDGDLIGIEVKAASTVNKTAFKHLLWFKIQLNQTREFTAIVLYTGTNLLSFGQNMWAVPIHLLF